MVETDEDDLSDLPDRERLREAVGSSSSIARLRPRSAAALASSSSATPFLHPALAMQR
jgi:hypothetical protein